MRRRTSGENVLRLIRIRLNLRCRLMPYSHAAYRTLVVPTLEASELYFSGSFARENRRLRHHDPVRQGLRFVGGATAGLDGGCIICLQLSVVRWGGFGTG